MPKLIEGYNMLIWENDDGTATYTGSFNRSEWDRYLESSGSEVAEDVEVPAEPESEPSESEPESGEPVEQPAGNASADEWLEFARTRPEWDESDADLGRNDLRNKYGREE
jgi:hypothetical protein